MKKSSHLLLLLLDVVEDDLLRLPMLDLAFEFATIASGKAYPQSQPNVLLETSTLKEITLEKKGESVLE